MKQLLEQLIALAKEWLTTNETLKSENETLKAENERLKEHTDADLLKRIEDLEAERAEAIATIEAFITSHQ